MFPPKKKVTCKICKLVKKQLIDKTSWLDPGSKVFEIVDEQHVIAHDFCICMVINDVI